MADTAPLFNPNDGLVGRDGGPYLDVEEAKTAERRRAELEGRKPDLENPGASAGIQLVTAAQLIHQASGVMSVVSKERDPGPNAEKMVMAIADDDSNEFRVQGEIPKKAAADLHRQQKDKEITGEDFNPNDPNAPVSELEVDIWGDPVNDSGEKPVTTSEPTSDVSTDDPANKVEKSDDSTSSTTPKTTHSSTTKSSSTTKK